MTRRASRNTFCFAALICLVICAVLVPAIAEDSSSTFSTWSDYLGGVESAQYSSLAQINRSNVSKLQVAWKFSMGGNDAKGSPVGVLSFSPIQANDSLFVLGLHGSIVALDAATGEKLWESPAGLGRSRGLNYWQSKDGSDRRILYTTNGYLQELNAKTGDPIRTFGTDGKIDLRLDLGRDPNKIVRVQSGTPGRVFENLIIMGSATGEMYDSPPGDIRAYNVVTGQKVWTFHTIPHKGEPGYETWPAGAAEAAGGANVWGEMAVDEKRGIVYAPTAAGGYNFYGGEREGKNLYGDCLLALDARTGKLLWYFQNIHHDIWDMDSPTAPKLMTVTHNGKKQDVVVQVTKVGFVFAFDRVTGEPLWPIEERPVPPSPMKYEHAYPTQPFPTQPPSFAIQSFTEKNINPYLTPEEKAKTLQRLATSRNGMFAPPSDKQDTIQMPGNHGGANWGMTSIEPATGSLFVVTLNVPTIIKLVNQPPARTGAPANPASAGRDIFQKNCSLCHGVDLKGQPPVIPALVDVTQRLSDNDIKTMVRQGKSVMPSFASLSDDDLNNLLAYLHNPSSAPPDTDQGAEAEPTATTRYYVNGWGFVFSKDGLPLSTPPWATLTAYDMNKGTIRWQTPLGDDRGLAAKGIKNTGGGGWGVIGGISTTAGGLIFSGATGDGIFRAIDQSNGKVLWQTDLPMASSGIPTIYQVDGREYIILCVSVSKKSKVGPIGYPQAGDGAEQEQPGYIAFALPSNKKAN